jgi:hypothetical protein
LHALCTSEHCVDILTLNVGGVVAVLMEYYNLYVCHGLVGIMYPLLLFPGDTVVIQRSKGRVIEKATGGKITEVKKKAER